MNARSERRPDPMRETETYDPLNLSSAIRYVRTVGMLAAVVTHAVLEIAGAVFYRPGQLVSISPNCLQQTSHPA